MVASDLKILDEREQIHMTASWTEYLCFQRMEDNRFELSIRGYEILGEVREFVMADDNLEDDDYEFELPKEIEGQAVAGIEGEYIVGHALVNHSDEHWPISFANPSDGELRDWLDYADWDTEKIRTSLSKLCAV
jgi:hypothetical protein